MTPRHASQLTNGPSETQSHFDKHTLLTPDFVAQDVLKISEKTLANWRGIKTGPPFTKVGRKVLYPADLLLQWLASRTDIQASGEVRTEQRVPVCRQIP